MCVCTCFTISIHSEQAYLLCGDRQTQTQPQTQTLLSLFPLQLPGLFSLSCVGVLVGCLYVYSTQCKYVWSVSRSDRRVVEGERKRERKRESVFRKAGVEGVVCTDRCQYTGMTGHGRAFQDFPQTPLTNIYALIHRQCSLFDLKRPSIASKRTFLTFTKFEFLSVSWTVYDPLVVFLVHRQCQNDSQTAQVTPSNDRCRVGCVEGAAGRVQVATFVQNVENEFAEMISPVPIVVMSWFCAMLQACTWAIHFCAVCVQRQYRS